MSNIEFKKLEKGHNSIFVWKIKFYEHADIIPKQHTKYELVPSNDKRLPVVPYTNQWERQTDRQTDKGNTVHPSFYKNESKKIFDKSLGCSINKAAPHISNSDQVAFYFDNLK